MAYRTRLLVPYFTPVLVTNQVTSNVVIGRSILGVHWRMDGVYGALMGETSAVRRLQQVSKHYVGPYD